MYTAEDLCTPVPLERWDVECLSAEDDVLRSNMLRAAYFLDRVDQFDDSAFRQSKSEAIAMDPQTRVLLEQSYATLQVSSWSESLLRLGDSDLVKQALCFKHSMHARATSMLPP